MTGLLIAVVKNGKICYEIPEIMKVQPNAKHNIASLPEVYKSINCNNIFPVRKSKNLELQKIAAEKDLTK